MTGLKINVYSNLTDSQELVETFYVFNCKKTFIEIINEINTLINIKKLDKPKDVEEIDTNIYRGENDDFILKFGNFDLNNLGLSPNTNQLCVYKSPFGKDAQCIIDAKELQNMILQMFSTVLIRACN